MRKIVLIIGTVAALGTQGCATNFQTFLTGAVVGGALVGASQCSRFCY
ncbi:hypothetical protein [Robbsia andropogonis]|nr:hypothetical protein [Robbsia andropogonis]MCP1117057.1 hypothetical protein [Robbsia andropogonis]MCP1128404.1 hypothetical protein [Robbsia andropogonis]